MKNKKSLSYILLYRMDLLWVNFGVAACIITAVALYSFLTKSIYVGVISIALILLLLAFNIIIVVKRRQKAKKEAQNLGFTDENSTICTGLLDGMMLPAFIITKSARLIWTNSDFEELCNESGQKPGTVAGGIFMKHLDEALNSQKSIKSKIVIGDRTYNMYASNVYANKELCGNTNVAVCAYFVDVSGVESLMNLYRERRIVLGQILIDNFDEIFQQNGEAVSNQVLVEVNNIFEQWLKDKNAIVKKLTRERYILILESKCLEQIEGERFHVLEKVKKISVGNTVPVTLSIGINSNSVYLTDKAFEALIEGNIEDKDYIQAFSDTLPDSLQKVEQLLSLSLSRGGDQAIVRRGDGAKDSRFFGGSEIDNERDDKVEVRVLSEILEKNVNEASRVLIMGHSFADLDALGASLVIFRIARALGKAAYIVMDAPNQQIDVMFEALMQSGSYNDAFIKKNEALNILDQDTLVVVVDTFAQNQCEAPEIVKNANKIIVIDHHRRGVDYIKDSIKIYTDTNASSASEICIEVMQYIFPEKDVLTLLEAKAAYGGILVDTKNMYFKTGKRTFAVASYLRQLGVKPIDVRSYIQPSYEDYMKVNQVISEMKLHHYKDDETTRGVAIAICTLTRAESNTVASIAADKMLEIAGIDCSFVIIKIDNDVSIKARSLGEVNVQVVLENPEIGGGGHLTAAGAYMKNTTPERAMEIIMEILKNKQ